MKSVDGSLSLMRRIYHTARLSVIGSSSAPSSSELVTLSVLAYGLPLPSTGPLAISSSAWSRAHSITSRSRSQDKKVLFDRPLEDAMALYETGHSITGAASGGSGNGTSDGRITPLGLMASAFVCEDIKERASKLFAQEIPTSGSSGVGIAALDRDVGVAYAGEPPVGRNMPRPTVNIDIDDDSSDSSVTPSVSLEEVVMLGRSLTKSVRDLTHLFEDVSAGIQPASRGVSFILDQDPNDSDSDEGENRNNKGKANKRGERDALTDARSLLEALILYRRIVHASSPLSSSSPVTPNTVTAAASFSTGVSTLSTSASTNTDSSGPNTPLGLDSDSDFDVGVDGEDDDGGSSEDARTTTTDATLTVDARRYNMSFGKKAGGASVGSRLALRRMLGSRTFASPPEINDARDRMVDYLVDTAY